MPIIKKNIYWILVIIWACFIFFMSNMDTYESNTKSKATTNILIESTLKATNKLGIKKRNSNKIKRKEVINKFNKPLRKIAHATEYCILSILIIIALTKSGLKEKKAIIISLLISIIYACSDEYHQTFINGRTGQFNDVLIDMLGFIIGLIIYTIIEKKLKYNKKMV